MSTSDNRPPVPHDEHVTEDLPALIGGDLDLDATRVVTTHLRACEGCRSELVEVAAGIGLMRRLDDSATALEGESRVASPKRPASKRRLAVVLAAAAVLVVLGITATTAFLVTRDDVDRTVVEFSPIENSAANGRVAMRASGAEQAMAVDTSLDRAPVAHYYEVWLLDRESGKMLPVGVLPPDGTGTYRLPSSLLDQYDTVDISLQADDGTTDHSSTSVLRADYA